eukprot:COSAG01_NODE_3732_length_5753_cov_3.662894_5_plen_136_part_00
MDLGARRMSTSARAAATADTFVRQLTCHPVQLRSRTPPTKLARHMANSATTTQWMPSKGQVPVARGARLTQANLVRSDVAIPRPTSAQCHHRRAITRHASRQRMFQHARRGATRWMDAMWSILTCLMVAALKLVA